MKAQGQGAPMTGPLLSVRNLEVRYGDLIGVADVSLDVPQGGVAPRYRLASTVCWVNSRQPSGESASPLRTMA